MYHVSIPNNGYEQGSTPFDQGFIFDHLAKTGGTSFVEILKQLFGASAVSPKVMGRPVDWALRRYDSYRVISGHFSPRPGDRTGLRHTVTLLRHPIDRVVSYYHYLRHAGQEGIDPAADAAKSYDLDGFLRVSEERADAQISNFMTRHFALYRVRDLSDDGGSLAAAREALERFHFIGLTEMMAETADLFCCRYGLPLIADAPRHNVTPMRLRHRDIGTATRNKLASLNQLDLDLYETAEQLFSSCRRAALRECIKLIQGCGPLPGVVPPPAAPAAVPVEPPQTARVDFGDRAIEIRKVDLAGARSKTSEVAAGEELLLDIHIRAHSAAAALTVGIEIRGQTGEVAFGTNTDLLGIGIAVSAGQDYKISFRLPANLELGDYAVTAALHTGSDHMTRCFHWWDGAAKFSVVGFGDAPFVGHSWLPVKVRWGRRARKSLFGLINPPF